MHFIKSLTPLKLFMLVICLTPVPIIDDCILTWLPDIGIFNFSIGFAPLLWQLLMATAFLGSAIANAVWSNFTIAVEQNPEYSAHMMIGMASVIIGSVVATLAILLSPTRCAHSNADSQTKSNRDL